MRGTSQINAIIQAQRSNKSGALSAPNTRDSRSLVQSNFAQLSGARSAIAATRTNGSTNASDDAKKQFDSQIESINSKFDGQEQAIENKYKGTEAQIKNTEQQLSAAKSKLSGAEESREKFQKQEKAARFSTLGDKEKFTSGAFSADQDAMKQEVAQLEAKLEGLKQQLVPKDAEIAQNEIARQQELNSAKTGFQSQQQDATARDQQFAATQSQFMGELGSFDPQYTAKLAEIDLNDSQGGNNNRANNSSSQFLG